MALTSVNCIPRLIAWINLPGIETAIKRVWLCSSDFGIVRYNIIKLLSDYLNNKLYKPLEIYTVGLNRMLPNQLASYSFPLFFLKDNFILNSIYSIGIQL